MLSKLYPPWVGGLESHAALLSRTLASVAGVQVSVVTGQQSAALARSDMEDAVRVERAATIARFARTPIAVGMSDLIRRTRPDLIHFHSPNPWAELVAPLRSMRVPVVVTYQHDVVRQAALRPFYRPILDRVLEYATRIVVWSAHLAEGSQALRRHRHKLSVIPGGIQTARFIPTIQSRANAATLRRRFATSGPVVLFVGRLVYYKGIRYLITALLDTSATLLIVGTGDDAIALKALAAGLGVRHRVHFIGEVTDEELPLYYQASDLLILPSCERTEAFGLVQLEAHASGIPSVCTSLPTGVVFANIDGVTGVVVPPKDSASLARVINLLCGDDALRRRLGAQAQRRAIDQFDISRCADRMMDVYRQSVAAAGMPS